MVLLRLLLAKARVKHETKARRQINKPIPFSSTARLDQGTFVNTSQGHPFRDSSDDFDDEFPPLPPPKHSSLTPIPPATLLPSAAPTHSEANESLSDIKQLGDYDLVRLLGRGGMGAVYLARHRTLGREAAIKVLNLGSLADPIQLTRFKSEAIIAAKLQHPNIVRLLEVGESEQGPFLVFEFVAGCTLQEHINSTPQPSRSAAEMLIKLSSAIEYAHSLGIIHRDLKPANILIDTDQTPRITDFGLARILGYSAGATRSGEIFGTPAYMPPEQAGGATTLIGPQADVYSLGAILFELLTGTPPFRGTDAMAVVLSVLSNEPPHPRQLDRSIPRDLETICLKCLEKQPSRRYASAQLLLDELQRFLEGRPILAKPTSIAERSWKWAKRRPALALLLALLVIGPSAFLSYSLWKNAELERLLERSDENFRSALEATQRRIASSGQPTAEVLEQELRFLTAIRARSSEVVATRYEGAIAAALAGQVLHKLERHDEALKSLDEAETILSRLVKDDSRWSSWYRSELASVVATRAQIEQARGEYEKAEASMRRGLAVFEQLAADDPTNPDLLRDQAAIWNNLGILANRRGSPSDALTYHREALQLKERLTRLDPRSTRYQSDLAISLNNLGSVLLLQEQYDEASEHLERAIRTIESLPSAARQESTNRFNEAGANLNLAEIHQRKGDINTAIEHYRQGVKLLEQLADSSPEIVAWQTSCAEAETQLGMALMNHDAVPANPEDELTAHAREILNEAVVSFESAATRYQRLALSHPDEPSYRELAAQLEPGIAQLRAVLNTTPE